MAKEKSATAKKAAGVAKAARKVKDRTMEAAADHPVIAEVVAAALVGAAAALKNPAKARELAESAADEITAAAKQGGAKGGALWQLALDVARRSLNSLQLDETGGKAKKAGTTTKGAKKPAKKKKKKAA